MNRLAVGLILSAVFHTALLGWHLRESRALPKVNVNPGKSSIAVQLQAKSRPEVVEEPEVKEVDQPEPEPKPTKKTVQKPRTQQPALKQTPDEQPEERAEPVETSPPKPETPEPKKPVEKQPETEQETKQDPQKPSVAKQGAEWVKKADYRSNPSPEYPEESRARGEEGTVILKVAVDKQGEPTEVTVQESSGYNRLDRRAKSTVSGWRFPPAEHAGVSIRSTVLVPIKFRLK